MYPKRQKTVALLYRLELSCSFGGLRSLGPPRLPRDGLPNLLETTAGFALRRRADKGVQATFTRPYQSAVSVAFTRPAETFSHVMKGPRPIGSASG